MARKTLAGRTAPGWRALGGTSRRYQNIATGQTISRERYEREYGSLKARGERTFKRAAARVPEPLRLSRPAPGRPSARTPRIDRVQPLTGRISRVVPLDLELDEFGVAYTEENRLRYNEFVAAMLANPKIGGVMYRLQYEQEGGGFGTVATKATNKASQPDFDDFVANIAVLHESFYGQDGRIIAAIEAVLLFQRKYVVPSKRKSRIKVRKRKKAKR